MRSTMSFSAAPTGLVAGPMRCGVRGQHNSAPYRTWPGVMVGVGRNCLVRHFAAVTYMDDTYRAALTAAHTSVGLAQPYGVVKGGCAIVGAGHRVFAKNRADDDLCVSRFCPCRAMDVIQAASLVPRGAIAAGMGEGAGMVIALLMDESGATCAAAGPPLGTIDLLAGTLIGRFLRMTILRLPDLRVHNADAWLQGVDRGTQNFT